ncbi:hypothetical protein [Slackia faecicanis]|uniref:hypothetical protein n=1 Tax=Slackia faecicanis TaxID=255723 RepID=UPI0011CE2B75|nr:hypothetical protein [Slackia faecicanis]
MRGRPDERAKAVARRDGAHERHDGRRALGRRIEGGRVARAEAGRSGFEGCGRQGVIGKGVAGRVFVGQGVVRQGFARQGGRVCQSARDEGRCVEAARIQGRVCEAGCFENDGREGVGLEARVQGALQNDRFVGAADRAFENVRRRKGRFGRQKGAAGQGGA